MPLNSFYSGHDYLVVKWLRPILVSHLLQLGIATFYTDSDVAYTTKPVWERYLKFVAEYDADGAWQLHDYHAGNYMMVPTAGAIAFLTNWSASAVEGIKEGQDDESYITRRNSQTFHRCPNWGCVRHVQGSLEKEGKAGQQAVLRTFLPGHYLLSDEVCVLSKPFAPILDLCYWTNLFIHPACVGFKDKLAIFKAQGVWFMDAESCAPRNTTASQVGACQPLQWRVPSTELPLYSCLEYGLALMRERQLPPPSPPPAAPPSPAAAATTVPAPQNA